MAPVLWDVWDVYVPRTMFGGGVLSSPSHAKWAVHEALDRDTETMLCFYIMGLLLKVLFFFLEENLSHPSCPSSFFLSFSVKLVLTSAGSQNSAHCIKQRWHLLSKDTNNPWTGFGREHVPALFETASPATADFAHLPSIYFVFVNNDHDPRAVWMSRRHLTGILSRWGAASLCSACQWGVLPSTCDCGKKQGHSCRLKKEKGTQSCIL